MPGGAEQALGAWKKKVANTQSSKGHTDATQPVVGMAQLSDMHVHMTPMNSGQGSTLFPIMLRHTHVHMHIDTCTYMQAHTCKHTGTALEKQGGDMAAGRAGPQ